MSEQSTTRRAKHVASSARILATGISATAVLGLTSALALAKPAWEANADSTSAVTAASPADAVALPGAVVPTSNTVAPAQSATATLATAAQPAAPVVTNPPTTNKANSSKPNPPAATVAPAPSTSQAPVVVTVPVPPSSGGNTGGNSKSNGS